MLVPHSRGEGLEESPTPTGGTYYILGVYRLRKKRGLAGEKKKKTEMKFHRPIPTWPRSEMSYTRGKKLHFLHALNKEGPGVGRGRYRRKRYSAAAQPCSVEEKKLILP